MKTGNDKIPKVVAGTYKVDKKLGGGSFGEIYKATHILTGKDVAVKFVSIGRI